MSASIRDLISRGELVIAPSVYDGMSARLVHQSGFQAAYIGSYGTGASLYGLPDLGFIGVRDVAEVVRRVAGVTDAALIVDGENGFGNALQVANSVRVLETAGASAIHIEDHVFGKHLGKQTVVPVGIAVDKIKAAVDARNDRTMIIARTDSIVAEGLDAAIDRLLAYQEAGADGLFMGAPNIAESLAPRLVASATVPIFAVNDPASTAAELGDAGAAVAMYFGLAHFSAYRALQVAYETLRDTGSTVEHDKGIPGMEEFDEFLQIESYRKAASTFHLIP